MGLSSDFNPALLPAAILLPIILCSTVRQNGTHKSQATGKTLLLQ